ncbi:MAG: S-methyl-5'-thioadenosine phosphorylase, partial [Victivallales bacterium]
MEGPAFSTAAESRIYHQLGFDVIGMTNLGEAKLAREAEICYSSIAMVTDYDSWHPHNEFVTVNMIVENFAANVALAKRIIVHMAAAFSGIGRKCSCGHALDGAVITHRDAIAPHLREKLDLIIGKYIK